MLSNDNSLNDPKQIYYQRMKHIFAKVYSCVDDKYTVIDKLGVGSCGSVFKVRANINGKPLNIVQKSFIKNKVHDDYDEFYANWQIRKYISKNISTIVKDPFLFECIDKIPFLFPTKHQHKILSMANSSSKEEYKNSQIASKLKQGIFFEIKGNQNLGDLINSENYKKLTFDDKMKFLLDISMGITILDKAGVIQRDLNCENIQIDLEKNSAYLIDFGKAIHTDIVHLFEDDEMKKNDYCGPFFYSSPPEAYESDSFDVFGDKYNSFNVGLIMLPLFFGKSGFDLMFNFKWSDDGDIVEHRKNLFYNLSKIIDELNIKNTEQYNQHQLLIIKSLMKKLINPDVDKRSNSEKIARCLYNKFIILIN